MSLIRNNLLLFIALIFVILSTLISLNIIYKPFSSTEELYVSGRTLFVKLQEPQDIQNIDNSNQKLISLRVEIINAASTELLLKHIFKILGRELVIGVTIKWSYFN